MNRMHVVILWHMHQPQYRDPSTGRYILPWTRLHALKDYWGMVHMLEEFPKIHATFNVVPSLAAQLEEYASGRFDEPWFTLAFSPAENLTVDDKAEILLRAFQVNRENMMRRWPRYGELFDWSQQGGAGMFGLRDWRDLQLLSQLAWMDEEYLAHDPVVSQLAHKGADYTEADKELLREKQLELLKRVLPEYCRAQKSGQIEISTTPFYHPILPLICNTDVARVANPSSLLPQVPFRHPEDALEQLVRARKYHQRLFGQPPAGLWPSEGSVSDQALAIAADLGFRWFATDEGVLGRTLNMGFGRNDQGVPWNADRLYAPLRLRLGQRTITGLFRDHYLSDLVGFVYSRMDSGAAAEDLYQRLRLIGERVQTSEPLTVSLILDGENAWEYFHKNGREFLKQFYRRLGNDPEMRALTVSEAIEAAGEIRSVPGISPGSWINANFDVWIGDREDITAWNLLAGARDLYSAALAQRVRGDETAPSGKQLATAYEALLAAEGSDWCWWFGPEHSSSNDSEFDAFFRKLLSEVYKSLNVAAPDELAEPIKRQPDRAEILAPADFLEVRVDGRESSYFEWLGAGLYSPEGRDGSMHGRVRLLKQLRYGFDAEHLYLRVDVFEDVLKRRGSAEFRITLRGEEELRVLVHVQQGKIADFHVETKDYCLVGPRQMVSAAYDRILEVSIARTLLPLVKRDFLSLSVALWEGSIPVDLLPTEGWLQIRLGLENFAWPR